MKTYDQRVKDILKKAKRRKIVGVCLKTTASTLCLVAIIVGLMYIPYGSSNVGVNPTNPTNEPIVTNPPTVTTVPTTKPSDPIATHYQDFAFEGLRLNASRVKLITESWAGMNRLGFSENMQFCDPASGVDGIRYYGSFTRQMSDGQIQTYDILYIPCQELPVASEFTFAGHTFRSWNGFGLYIFTSRYYSYINCTSNTFEPLTYYTEEKNGASTINDDVLATALKMHRSYEQLFYGSELTQMPEENPSDSMLRLKATWLLHNGRVPTFEDRYKERYYGNFNGYDIVFQPTDLMWVETQTIGGVEFTHGSSFVLYAIKDWQLYLLKDVYDQGFVSREDIIKIAKNRVIVNNPNIVLEEINELFGDLDSWYNKALNSEYDTPSKLVLSQFFLNAFREDGNEVTDSERTQLKELYGLSDYIDMVDITRLPADRMNQVLQEYFGISLDKMDVAADRDLHYLESTDCYYIIGGGASDVMDFKAHAIETNANGTITVYYTANWDDTEYMMTLVWHGDGYRIVSNVTRPNEIIP